MYRYFIIFALICPVLYAEDILLTPGDCSEASPQFVRRESRWDNLGVLHGEKGFVTWKFNVTKEDTYHVQFLYASDAARPCKLTLVSNNVPTTVQSVLAEPTGGFFAKNLKWYSVPEKFNLKNGECLLSIRCESCLPHLRGIRVTTESNLLADKTIFDKHDEAAAQARIAVEQKEAQTNRTLLLQELAEEKSTVANVKQIVFIKRATFQSSHYYTDFIDGTLLFGSELCLLNLETGEVRNLVPSLKDGIIGRCNLSFDAKKVIFDYKANLGSGFRIYEVGIDGGNLRQLTFPPEDEEQRIARYRMDKHNAVSQNWAEYRGIGAGIYLHHTDDMHPAYLPDGNFVFTSTRCEHGILCDGPDVLTASVLYRSAGAEADAPPVLEKLSDNALSESAPTVMEDGRILYTRWEYVDNGSVTNKGLWSINPDGTASFEIYGANIAYPSVFNVARQIPNEPTKFVCIGAPHMPVGVGPVLLVDTLFDRRTVDGVSYITPEVDCQYQWGWTKPIDGKTFTKLYEPPEVKVRHIQTNRNRDGRGNQDTGPLFMDPFPISEHRFLVSYNPDKPWNTPNGYGLYYINDKGDRKLIYSDPDTSIWGAQLVLPRTIPGMPGVAKDPKLAAEGKAQLVVVDVYAGMDGVKRGTVKYLRINEHVPRPWAARRYWDGDEFDQQHSVITMNTHLGLKAQYGVVPVEADGSANFIVPADKNIFIQALDENYREIQRERTFVNYRPGEVRSCVGCHERASETPVAGARALPLAMQRDYDIPMAQPGEKSGFRPISYFEDVQPVLDRHCVQCHNSEKAEGKINLEGKLTTLFNQSYETLMNWDAFPVIRENYPKAGNNHYLPPYSLGSHASRLVKLLDTGHYDIKMPKEDWIRLTTWVDSNGQYYGTYFGHKNLKYQGQPDFRPAPVFGEAPTK